jgi:hypothetical protein
LFRTCYPKIGHIVILSNLNEGIWSTDVQKGLSDLCLSQVIRPAGETPFPYPEERGILISKDIEAQRQYKEMGPTGLAIFSPVC